MKLHSATRMEPKRLAVLEEEEGLAWWWWPPPPWEEWWWWCPPPPPLLPPEESLLAAAAASAAASAAGEGDGEAYPTISLLPEAEATRGGPLGEGERRWREEWWCGWCGCAPDGAYQSSSTVPS